MGAFNRNAETKNTSLIKNFSIIEILLFLPEYILEFFRNRKDRFDEIYGVDTKLPVNLSDLDVNGENAKHAELYWPTNPRNFRRLITAARISLEKYTFIDIGSGKGRALLLATEFPFRQIIGVEFSKSLTEIAKKNIAIFQRKLGIHSRIEVFHQDATKFEFPQGPLFIYLFDPFRAEVMEEMILNLLRSMQQNPREVIVAYYLPMHRDLFVKYGFEKVCEQSRSLRLDYPWAIFRKSPPAKISASQNETTLS